MPNLIFWYIICVTGFLDVGGGWQSATTSVVTLPAGCGTLPLATLSVGCGTLPVAILPVGCGTLPLATLSVGCGTLPVAILPVGCGTLLWPPCSWGAALCPWPSCPWGAAPCRGVRWGGRPFRVSFRPIFAGRWVSVLNKNLLDYFSITLSTVLHPR